MNDKYYWPDGSLRWTHPVNVEHLILQLQTMDPAMKVSSVMFLDMNDGRKPRAFGLSMSFERWNDAGWLDFKLPGPLCLAIWADAREENAGLARLDEKERRDKLIKLLCEELRYINWQRNFPKIVEEAVTRALAAAAKSEVGR